MKKSSPHRDVSTVTTAFDWTLVFLVAALSAYVFTAYGFGLRLAFVNDDYLFLDKAIRSSFFDLWKPHELIFGWYRPWSREFHYGCLLHLAGLREAPFHLVNFALWITDMTLYFVLSRRLVSQSAAVIGTAGLASLALWGTPVLWIAGAQDLWMLLFSLATLLAVAHGRTRWAFAPFALALFSKETAAAVPSIACAMLILIEKVPVRSALRKTAGLWSILVVWMVLHPTLRLRMFGTMRHSTESDLRPGPLVTATKTLLAQVNLQDRLAPEGGWPTILLPAAAAALLLGGLIYLAGRKGGKRTVSSSGIALGLAWALAGWWILFLPSIGWHAYYGCLGSMGFWLAAGTILSAHRRVAMALVMALAVLAAGERATLSWDWGSTWYQARAGRILGGMRSQLFQLHPTLPAHSRLYFAEIPNNVGFLAGDGPAVRIWYRDSTLRASYFSAYEPRWPAEPGSDYFFLFDTTRGLDEIVAGESPSDPGWRRRHGLLASLFIHSGNVSGAATEYAALARAPSAEPGQALFAAAAFEASGEPESARVYRALAVRSLGDSAVRLDLPELVAIARTQADSALWRRLVRRSGIKPNQGSSKEPRQQANP